MSDQRIVIVGAGQAAAQATETLRKRGHTGPITLIGDENSLPYQRPPLSKKYLAGSFDRDRLLFRHAAHYAEHDVLLRLGFPVVSIDRLRRRVEIADGSALEYDALLLATGSHPRLLPLPGAELAASLPFGRNSVDVPAGVEAAIERRCAEIGMPAVGLWAQVPHYAAAMPYPPASIALIDGLGEVAGLSLRVDSLRQAAAEHVARLDELVLQSDEHREMLRQLEAQADAETAEPDTRSALAPINPSDLPSGDDLAAELERYLREQG